MLPASIIVVPNSPRARAKLRLRPASRPGRISGRVTRQKTCGGLHPRPRATASSAGSSRSRAARVLRYISGKATTAALITVALQLNTTLIPITCKGWPSGPWGPSSSSSKKPSTVGGSTSGESSSRSARARRCPRQLRS